jgi:hypothetical protein
MVPETGPETLMQSTPKPALISKAKSSAAKSKQTKPLAGMKGL